MSSRPLSDLFAAKFGLVKGMSLDLNHGYDFDDKKDQDKAWEIIRGTKPTLVIGSPPCTCVVLFQELNIAVHGKSAAWMARFEAAKLKAARHWNSVARYTDIKWHTGGTFFMSTRGVPGAGRLDMLTTC